MRCVRARLILAAFVVGLAGCAAVPTLAPVRDTGQRLEFAEFSVLPPQGENWYVAPAALRDQQGLLTAFVKLGTPPSKTHTVVAGVRGSRGIYTGGDRSDFLTKLARMSSAPDERLRLVAVDIAPVAGLGADCVRYDATMEDRGVPGHTGQLFIMASHGFVCLHPRLTDAAMEIFYSERRPVEEQALPLAAEGEPFLKSLLFK